MARNRVFQTDLILSLPMLSAKFLHAAWARWCLICKEIKWKVLPCFLQFLNLEFKVLNQLETCDQYETKMWPKYEQWPKFDLHVPLPWLKFLLLHSSPLPTRARVDGEQPKLGRNYSHFAPAFEWYNKLASLEATLVRNYERPTEWLTEAMCRAISILSYYALPKEFPPECFPASSLAWGNPGSQSWVYACLFHL